MTSAVAAVELLKEKRISLPWPSATLFGEPGIALLSGDLHLALQFEGRKRRARLIFFKQRVSQASVSSLRDVAHRKRVRRRVRGEEIRLDRRALGQPVKVHVLSRQFEVARE